MTDRTQEILDRVEKAKADILEAWGNITETEAKTLTPVDTGRLRNSITHKRDGDYIVVGTAVEYSPKVEFDEYVRHRVGQAHYLRDGVIRTSEERQEMAKDILSQIR